MRAPTSLELAVEIMADLGKGEDFVRAAFDVRKWGMVVGWAVLSVGDLHERRVLLGKVKEELSSVYSGDPSEVVEGILFRYGHRLDKTVFEEPHGHDRATRMRAIVGETVGDDELGRTLDASVPEKEREGILMAWAARECNALDEFREGMLARGEEGQFFLRPETGRVPTGGRRESL